MEAGMRLAVERGSLMQALPAEEGVMAAMRCSQDEVEAAIAALSSSNPTVAGRVAVATVNGPESVVVAGADAAVTLVTEKLGKKAHRLTVSHAFHSPLMLPMADTFRSVLQSMDMSPCAIPLASTVTGTLIMPGESIGVEHWVRQVSEPVLFWDLNLVIRYQSQRH